MGASGWGGSAEEEPVLDKVLPVAVTALIAVVVPALSLAQAPSRDAVSMRARATLTMAELSRNSAAGLATPVGIATARGRACEVRCEIAEGAGGPDASVALRCATGDVRSVDGAAGVFDATAKWGEGGMAFAPASSISLEGCD